MAIDPTMLKRFRAASMGLLPDDLRGWALAALTGQLAQRDRRSERDDLVREAGAFLTGLKPWPLAERLRAEMVSLFRAVPARPAPHTLRGCLAEVLLITGKPLSTRGLYRILTRSH